MLEVGELSHLHTIQPDFPAQSPGAQRWVLPVVFYETDVILLEVKTQRLEAAEVELKDVARGGLEHHLVLVVVLQTVRVFAIATILGATAGLHVSGFPRLGA